MASNLRVDQILPSVGTNVAIGTATGTVTLAGTTSFSGNLNVSGGSLSGISTLGVTTAYINTLSGISTISANSSVYINQNLVFPSGKGIDFSATSNSSGTMTAELLDDYEEGTWTPYFCETGTGNASNMFVNNGLTIYHATYVKTGKYVWFSCYIRNDTSFSYDTGRSGTEGIGIGGLPFTVTNNPVNSGFYPIYCGYYGGWTGYSSGYTPMGYVNNGTRYVSLVYANGSNITALPASTLLSADSGIIIAGYYQAA